VAAKIRLGRRPASAGARMKASETVRSQRPGGPSSQALARDRMRLPWRGAGANGDAVALVARPQGRIRCAPGGEGSRRPAAGRWRSKPTVHDSAAIAGAFRRCTGRFRHRHRLSSTNATASAIRPARFGSFSEEENGEGSSRHNLRRGFLWVPREADDGWMAAGKRAPSVNIAR